jgi:hypothetical protein
MPGFTAHASLYEASGNFQSEAIQGSGNGTRDNQVQMQKSKSENTPGGNCTGVTSGTIIKGTYDSQGRCCTGTDQKGFPFCIDCDTDHCYDRQSVVRATVANIQRGVFARL